MINDYEVSLDSINMLECASCGERFKYGNKVLFESNKKLFFCNKTCAMDYYIPQLRNIIIKVVK